MFYYMQVGGIFMWPIFFLAVLSLAAVLEKLFLYFVRLRDLGSKFKLDIVKNLNNQTFEKIGEIYQNYKNPLAKVVCAASNFYLTNKNISKSEYEFLIKTMIDDEISKLEKNNWILGICISASPQLGLLGTIVGMIKSFGALSAAGDPTLVAGGISEALYTTAFGLLVAIPALVFHVYFINKNDSIMENLEKIEFLLLKKFEGLRWEE